MAVLRSPRRRVRFAAAAIALALTAAACGGGDDTSSSGTGPAGAAASTTTETPRDGGTLRFGQFGASPGLDPATQPGSGAVGGIELAAMYDTLMRYDRATQKYVPGTAESLTPNADFTVWTLKLRSGLTFTDGTAYDGAAVKFAIDRILSEGNSIPKGVLVRLLASTVVNDPLTVTFTLKVGFAGFPSVFNNSAGFIYSPTAFAKAGSAQAFNLNPGNAGAGPFMFKSFKPGESMELVKNPNYFGGKVHLDGITFTLAAGPQAALTSLQVGTTDIALIRDPDVLSQAKDKFDTLVMPAPAGNMINMNSGIKITCKGGKPEPLCTGVADGTAVPTKTATADPRVRRAVAAAIDPQVINARVWNGKANVGTAPFANTVSDPKVAGPKYDPAEAKRLVAAAKADGWDGKIRLVATMDPTGAAWGVAIEAQLEAVGMDVTIDPKADTAALVNQVLVLRDFDLTTYAYGLNEEPSRNYLKLVGAFEGASPLFGFASPEMVKGLDALRVAATPAELEAAYKTIAEIWTRDVPALAIAEIPEAAISAKKVKGVEFIGASIVTFDKAWLSS